MTLLAVLCFIVAPLLAWGLTALTLPKDNR